jgi:hypothetical protein
MEVATMARGQITGRKSRATPDHAKRHPGPPRADADAVEPTTHITTAAYSIREFCAAHRLSESLYFKLRNQGLGPAEMFVGSRRIISFEAAERWRRAREV